MRISKANWGLPAILIVGAQAAAAFQAARAADAEGARKSESAVPLDPAGWFRVPGAAAADDMWFDAFAAMNGRIYFLLNSGPGAQPRSALVETDLDGAVIRRNDLQASVTSFAADRSGQVAARLRDKGQSKILVWRDMGSTPVSFEDRDTSALVAFHEGMPMLMSQSRLADFYPAPGQASIPLPHIPDPPGAIMVLPLGSERTAVIGRMSGMLAVIEHRSILRTLQLAAPPRSSGSPDIVELAVAHITADETGTIYYGGTGAYKRDEGEEIFALDDGGQTKGHFRLRPAMLTHLQRASNPKGYASPWAITASNGRLFAAVGSKASASVVWYTIPK